ncbi:hypothetical protein BDP81DRAFT_434622 [Colletotrichum phormii]|uniref:Uncharacterized protein n=1 Tax=Colletotrichum phormii TaxID=359342 RepID=A0AAI9ZMC5_9PEZI|nr:uncharacterized protein BDP81DRAFT_434622 [Colletotrichum phormii]KAK1633299.1 hypothetical protein BDP81DRAFT_434622 [Colletotrichum phormii]
MVCLHLSFRQRHLRCALFMMRQDYSQTCTESIHVETTSSNRCLTSKRYSSSLLPDHFESLG